MSRFHLLYFLILCIILLIFPHCAYKPHLEFDRNIKKPDSASIAFTLNPSDSVYTFYESSYLNYNLNTFGLPVYSAVFFLGDQKIHESQDSTGTLYFPYDYNNLGEYKLTMVVTTGTKSGSLADILHSEGFVFSRSWKIIMARANPPSASQITRIVDTAGTVKICFTKNNQVAFKQYQLFKASDLNGNIWDESLIESITDQNATSVYDSTHIGGTVYYRIQVVNSGGSAMSLYYVHESDKSNLQASWLDGNRIKLSWNPCIFYKNFKQYTITDESFGGGVVYSTDTIGISSFIYTKAVFGGGNKFKISITANKSNYIYNDDNSSAATGNVGQPFPVFETFNNNQVNNTVYLLNEYNLTKINATSGTSYGTINLGYGIFSCAVAPLGNLVIAPLQSGYIRIDPADFFNPENVTIANTTLCSNATLSNSCTGMMHYEWPQIGNTIYDFLNKSTIFSKNSTTMNCGSMSPDGNYIVTGFWPFQPAACYRITNNDFEFVWSSGSHPCEFLMNPQLLVLVNSATATAELRDVSSSQIMHSFSIGQTDQYQDTDPFHPLMLFTTFSGDINQCKLKVYNYLTGTKVFEMVSMNTNLGSGAFAIQDSTIYSGAGFRIKIH
jgi:hypothetical protein